MAEPLFDSPSKSRFRKVLECVECRARFSLEDIERGDYQFATLTCSACYAIMQKAPHERSCFGKPTVIDAGTRKRKLGFDPGSVECSRLCRDRVLCRRVLEGPLTVEASKGSK